MTIMSLFSQRSIDTFLVFPLFTYVTLDFLFLFREYSEVRFSEVENIEKVLTRERGRRRKRTKFLSFAFIERYCSKL